MPTPSSTPEQCSHQGHRCLHPNRGLALPVTMLGIGKQVRETQAHLADRPSHATCFQALQGAKWVKSHRFLHIPTSPRVNAPQGYPRDQEKAHKMLTTLPGATLGVPIAIQMNVKTGSSWRARPARQLQQGFLWSDCQPLSPALAKNFCISSLQNSLSVHPKKKNPKTFSLQFQDGLYRT